MVSRPIRKSLNYDSETDKLPTTTVDQLVDLVYISRAADRCLWKGKECVFKRIEFDVDVRTITREIQAREKLLTALGSVTNPNITMLQQFSVVPILAVVIGNRAPWTQGTVAGLVLPYAGRDLGQLTEDTSGNLPISELQLRNLVKGVQEMNKNGVLHRDIRFWNTILQPADGNSPARLVLIDVGSEGPDYPGDAKALGELLLWCLKHAPSLRHDSGVKTRIEAAAAALTEENYDRAINALTCRVGTFRQILTRLCRIVTG